MVESAAESAGEHEKLTPAPTTTMPATTVQDDAGAASASSNEDGSEKKMAELPAGEKEKPPGAEKPIERSPLKVALIMLALCFAVFLHALDTTIITTALPTITEAFRMF